LSTNTELTADKLLNLAVRPDHILQMTVKPTALPLSLISHTN